MKQNFAVIGHPIGHTMSPFIHKKLFELSGKDVAYRVFDISPENLSYEFCDTLQKLDGYNITIPHKEAIMSLIDEIDPSASKYNAVNCVLNRDGKSFGCSTDAFGFVRALEASNVRLSGKVLVLGAGGAATTLAREALDRGCEITIAVRESGIERAEALKKRLDNIGGKVTVCTLDRVCGKFDLVINATPVGMYPNIDKMPLTEAQIKGCKAVFDAVYNPEKTLLIKVAEALGIKTVGGMAMLVWQAVKAHEFWYGADFDTTDIEEIIADSNREMERMFYEK